MIRKRMKNQVQSTPIGIPLIVEQCEAAALGHGSIVGGLGFGAGKQVRVRPGRRNRPESHPSRPRRPSSGSDEPSSSRWSSSSSASDSAGAMRPGALEQGLAAPGRVGRAGGDPAASSRAAASGSAAAVVARPRRTASSPLIIRAVRTSSLATSKRTTRGSERVMPMSGIRPQWTSRIDDRGVRGDRSGCRRRARSGRRRRCSCRGRHRSPGPGRAASRRRPAGRGWRPRRRGGRTSPRSGRRSPRSRRGRVRSRSSCRRRGGRRRGPTDRSRPRRSPTEIAVNIAKSSALCLSGRSRRTSAT